MNEKVNKPLTNNFLQTFLCKYFIEDKTGFILQPY